jgi:hypothetical protein
LFEPGDDVGVETEADGLFDGAVKRPRTAFFQAAAGSSGMSEVSMGRPGLLASSARFFLWAVVSGSPGFLR